MDTRTETIREVEGFVEGWQGGDGAMKNGFLALYRCAAGLEDTVLSFIARPGISYSLRPKHRRQEGRELFASIDVIDDDPEERWLSVCFYGDMISDPEERGELIPGGLAGSDGYCFDIYQADSAAIGYLQERLIEAWRRAGE